ncbi:Adenine/guanine permease AZG1 [Platanthera guangdongensis]|uniref:Adenine/guanine permease AZG1 n=1 Tax=Platanthera guangdongensis TaxID=2320717 RepID=A0ABR2LLG2_9ASPA
MAAFFSRISRMNIFVSSSSIGRRFKISNRGTNFTIELRAGTTFLTMVYILAVNASIISDSGTTCFISDCFHPSPSCKFPPEVDPGYTNCIARALRELITATVVASLIGSALMGFFANLSIALAPGMGTNAYFAYSVVGFHGLFRTVLPLQPFSSKACSSSSPFSAILRRLWRERRR